MKNTTASIQDNVYSVLRDNIINLRLVPGSTISTQEISTKLQVSRTPVREAFIRLQRDGLVQMFPQRETLVSLIDMNRVQQERFMRIHLEQAALRLFFEKAMPYHLLELQSLIEKQVTACDTSDYEVFHYYDNKFHQIFFDGAGEPLVWDMISQSSTHYQRIRILSLKYHGISDDIVKGHEKILSALKAHNLELLLSLHKTHLQKLDEEEYIFFQTNPEYFLTKENKPILTL